MTFTAMLLSALLLPAPHTASPPAVQREIETFVGHLKNARMAEAYGQLSARAKAHIGRAQFDAYVASRRRTLGAIAGVSNVRLSDHVEPEPGVTAYEADVRFEKATAPSGFVMTKEGPGWRIHLFVIGTPDGVKITADMNEAAPIASELMALVKSESAAALATRFSDKDLADAQQTRETAVSTFKMFDDLLGRLQSFALDKPQPDDTDCMKVDGNGTFEYGKAPLHLVLCWSDGVWRLRHATITPLMEPRLLERSIAYTFQGRVTAECPRAAAFPVGGTIVCRVTEHGRPPQNATVLRTTPSGWKIIALEPAGK
jgi:hypothetical protein